MNTLIDVVQNLIENTQQNNIRWIKSFNKDELQCVINKKAVRLIRTQVPVETSVAKPVSKLSKSIFDGIKPLGDLDKIYGQSAKYVVTIRFYDSVGELYEQEDSRRLAILTELYNQVITQQQASVNLQLGELLSDLKLASGAK